MTVVVKSLDDLGRAAVEAFEDDKERIIMSIYNSLMIHTPHDTGTLKANWRLSPGAANNTYFIPNTGDDVVKKPIKNAMTDYVRNWKKFTLYNNSPYVGFVNNGVGGNKKNQNFIQKAVANAQSVGSFVDEN